jgi:hypothetical protein
MRAIDGLVDGLIDDPRKCEFNPETLLCKGRRSNCLTRRQSTLQRFTLGPTGGGKQSIRFARGERPTPALMGLTFGFFPLVISRLLGFLPEPVLPLLGI